jgi:hypothetical protein
MRLVAGRTGLEPGLRASNLLFFLGFHVRQACVRCVCSAFAVSDGAANFHEGSGCRSSRLGETRDC